MFTIVLYSTVTSGTVYPDVCVCQYHDLIVFIRSVMPWRANTHTHTVRSRTRPTPPPQILQASDRHVAVTMVNPGSSQTVVLPISPCGCRNRSNPSRVHLHWGALEQRSCSLTLFLRVKGRMIKEARQDTCKGWGGYFCSRTVFTESCESVEDVFTDLYSVWTWTAVCRLLKTKDAKSDIIQLVG